MSTVAGPVHEVCSSLDLSRVPAPAFVVDLSRLRKNLKHLAAVKAAAGCRILLAQKGFSMWATYPLIRQYLDGTCSSGPWEAMLAREKFGKEIHVGQGFNSAKASSPAPATPPPPPTPQRSGERSL